jgi:hypothetical protein
MFPVTRSTSRSRFFKPAAATPAPATDPFFEYVPLLLNTSATNGAQNNTFLDSSTNNFTVTRNGDTTQGSFNPYMPSGYWSGYFDGADDRLTVADNAALRPGTGNFTIEAWVFRTASGAAHTIYAKGGASTGFVFQITSANLLRFTDTTTNIDSTGTVAANTWVHVAVVREGTGTNQLKLYISGTNDGQGTVSTNFNQTEELRIGENRGATEDFSGYISNVRFATTAVYTTAFTPPTTPLTAITNTSLLCLQDNRFIDNSTNAFAITRNGDTRISKFAPFNPPASYSTASYVGSGYFDGTGDYLRIADNAAFTLGSGDFTVEAWVYNGTSGTRQVISGQGDSSGLQSSISYYVEKTAANKLRSVVCSSSTEYAAVSTADLPLNQWVHVAFVRNGNTGTNYINGVADGTVNLTGITVNNSSNQVAIGALGELTTLLYTGYISNFRQVVGTAVYTANFTPPTTPLTAITNTSLLLNFTNAGIFDAATINNGQTVGNAQVSTTQAKWSPTSMAFDGTGDYLTVIDKPELRIGTGDFTIEGWVYLNATGVAYGLVSKGTASTGWSVNVTSGNKLQFSYTATQLTGATSLASGTWYYFAVVRSGTASGNLRVILDGATDATSAGAVNDNFNQTNVLYVGADRVAGAVLNGYLQDVRITNGFARTTSTPTAAFPTL